jgi:hypothetical protein
LTGSLYSVDTSALIDGLERYYFEDTFPGIWEKVAELIAEGRFFISDEVWDEVQKKTDVVQAWCEKDATGNLIVPTDGPISRQVKAILQDTPRLVANMTGRNRADSFVVALAVVRGATVVTGEGSDGNEDRPKIPYVCGKLGVPCIRFTELLRNEGWKLISGS